MSQTANFIAKLNAVVDPLLKIAIVIPSRCDEHRRGNKTGSLMTSPFTLTCGRQGYEFIISNQTCLVSQQHNETETYLHLTFN